MSRYESRPRSYCLSNRLCCILLIFSVGLQLGFLDYSSAQIMPPQRSEDDAGALGHIDCVYISACIENVTFAQRVADAKELPYALSILQETYARWRSPWLLINIGRTQQRLLRPVDAVATYRRYLDLAPDDWPERTARAQSFLYEAEQEAQRQSGYLTRTLKARRERSLHKKPWFWGIILGTAVISSGITAGILFAIHPELAQKNYKEPRLLVDINF